MKYQFTSRKGIGTDPQTLEIVEEIKEGFQRREIRSTMLFDVEKSLIYKMIYP